MSEPATQSSGGLVSAALLDRFLERIGEDLRTRPDEMPVEPHRAEVARLLETAGGATHYELLQLDGGATAETVTAAFTALARKVYPENAARLGIPEPLLRLLFEHAARAYLVLSDPDRRREYDRIHKAPQGAPQPRSAEDLQAARRQMARACFVRAQAAMQAEHYHTVVELLREAVRWEPRAEASALLAEAMSHNPRWHEAAVDHFRDAVQLAPREPAYRLRLAQLLEQVQKPQEAVAEYRHVLQRVPSHPEALAGLGRLGASV
jgi:tetratricopeptide (TPR) repeat protein